MSEISMWLFSVVIGSVVGFFINLRYGWRWTWGYCLQHALIVIVCVMGFALQYMPLEPPLAVHRMELAGYCAEAAWAMFFAFSIGQRFVLNQLSLDLQMFRIPQAMKRARTARLLTWGPPGQYFYDMALALKHYNENDVAGGDAIVDKWRRDKRLTPSARESLVGYFMLGRIMLNDWYGIVTEFESSQSALVGSRNFVPFQMASRAYAELSRYSEAETCMRKANLNPSRTSATALDINFMQLFALFGALDQLHDVLNRCRDFRALPIYMRDYWLGRCFAVRGDSKLAIEFLSKSKNALPAQMTPWLQRIDARLREQQFIFDNGVPNPGRAAEPETSVSAERLYIRLRTIVDILRPTKVGVGTLSLMVLLVVAYITSNCDQFFSGVGNQAQLIAMHKSCYDFGQLSLPTMLHGEAWRLFTYQILHGNSAHLFMNVFALWFLGRYVENGYGTWRFLTIFLISGVLSGVLQVFASPQDSVIGASGAIFGVFGAAIAGLIKLKHALPPSVQKSALRWMIGLAVAQAIFDQVVNGIIAFFDKSSTGVRIGAFAHLGGIFVGLAIGMLLPIRKFKNDKE